MELIIEWSRMLTCLTVAEYGMSVYLSSRRPWASAPRSPGDAKQGMVTGAAPSSHSLLLGGCGSLVYVNCGPCFF